MLERVAAFLMRYYVLSAEEALPRRRTRTRERWRRHGLCAARAVTCSARSAAMAVFARGEAMAVQMRCPEARHAANMITFVIYRCTMIC